jgi:HAD superfamily hydrolase (TIGR01509 family)
MSQRNLDALIFDMGNVLIDWTPCRLVKHFVQDETLVDPLTEAIFHSAQWRLLDQGLIEESEVIDHVCAQFPLELHSIIANIVTRWPEANVMDERMIPLTNALAQNGMKLYLGSNASLRFHTYKSDLRALDVFDGIQISADIQLSKPDPHFFEVLMSTYGLDPQRTGFIDDVQANCDSAATLGLTTFHYTKDFEALVAWLNAQGVLKAQDRVEENVVLS